MPPVLRSSRLPPESSTATTRPKRRRGTDSHCRKRRSKITRRRRSIDLPIWEAQPEDPLGPIVSTSCYSSSFPMEFAVQNGIFFPSSVKRKPRSSCRRASMKRLPRSFMREQEAANSSTSGVEIASADVSARIHGDELKDEFGLENFMKSTDEAVISTAKFGNFDRSCSEICEGSNSFKPELVYIPGQNSPENPSDNEKHNLEMREKMSETFREKAPEACVSELTVEAEAEGLRHDLACSEQFSCSDYENRDGDRPFSNRFKTSAFSNSSLLSFSDFSPMFFESSGDEFSEGQGETVHSSACFLLFLEYRKEFCRSGSEEGKSSTVAVKIDNIDDFRMFEDDEDEQTYSKLRFRERRRSCRHRYVEQQAATEEDGVICSQRLSLVNWIVEPSSKGADEAFVIGSAALHQLQSSIGDDLLKREPARQVPLQRFFQKRKSPSDPRNRLRHSGHQDRRKSTSQQNNWCLIASRITSSRSSNSCSIRNEEFQIGDNLYRRCEVVAMEWVILDVLEYECFSPTTLNFLWYENYRPLHIGPRTLLSIWFYLKAAEADEELERHAKVLAISSLSHHEMLYFWPSTVAAGLVVQACSAKGQRSAAERIFESELIRETQKPTPLVDRINGQAISLKEKPSAARVSILLMTK
ncbi:Cyclin-SDS [Nymphaea thermarum]|nr:Cyclin-SDS [Nymphaea thermarum]